MSVVTNVILAFACSGKSRLITDELKKFEYNGATPFTIKSIDDDSLPRHWYGGSKVMEANLCLGAYNHLDVNALVMFLRNVQWDDPACVQLIVKEEGDFALG